jgi:hypothetical protein
MCVSARVDDAYVSDDMLIDESVVVAAVPAG